MIQMLYPILRDNHPRNQQNANQAIDNALATTVFALRAAVHTTLKTSPDVLAFYREILNTPFVADLRCFLERRQEIIDLSAARENTRRIDHHY